MLEPMHKAAELIMAAGKTLICGNGGSASEALHLASELLGRFQFARGPIPAMALLDPATLTAIGNDYGFEQVFSRQVEGLGNPGDVLVAISTSGTSPNVVEAAKAAKTKGMKVIALTGGTGGHLACHADVLIAPPGETAYIQERHLMAIHQICRVIDGFRAVGVSSAYQMGEHTKSLACYREA